MSMIIGDGFVEDVMQQIESCRFSEYRVGDDSLDPKELSRLQKFIGQIQRPSWHTLMSLPIRYSPMAFYF